MKLERWKSGGGIRYMSKRTPNEPPRKMFLSVWEGKEGGSILEDTIGKYNGVRD